MMARKFRSDAQRRAVMSRLSNKSTSSGTGIKKIDLLVSKPMTKAQQLVRIGELVKVKEDRNRLWVIYGQSDPERPSVLKSDVLYIGKYSGDVGANKLYKRYKDKLIKKYGYGQVGMIRMFNFYNPESHALGYE